MVLLVVLADFAFLLPLILFGVEDQRYEIRRVQNELSLQQARRLAESLLGRAVAVITEDGQAGGMDHLGEAWSLPMAGAGVEPGDGSVRIVDAARYINLDDLVLADGRRHPALFHVLVNIVRHLQMDPTLLDAVVDWLDPDDLPTGLGGAEMDWYQGLNPGYRVANGPLLEIGELTYLKGWDEKAVAKLRPFLRATPDCPNSGINVNTAAPELLSFVSGGWDMEAFVNARAQTPLSSVAQMNALGFPVPASMVGLVRFHSNCFEVHVEATVGDVRGVLEGWLVRQRGKVNILRTRWSG